MNDYGFDNVKVFVKLMLIGFFLMIVVVFNYTRSVEYPTLTTKDSLNSQITSLKIDRTASFITFDSNKKYHIPRSLNLSYKEFINISSIITTGDRVTKKPFSDTIRVQHDGKIYLYVLGKTIQ